MTAGGFVERQGPRLVRNGQGQLDALAEELLLCVPSPMSPALPTRTEMLVFVGELWADFAQADACGSFVPAVPEPQLLVTRLRAVAATSLVCVTAPLLPT